MGPEDSAASTPLDEYERGPAALPEAEPEAAEILAERIKPLRFAETYTQMLQAMFGR